MVVVRLSSSGRGVVLVDDEGYMFSCSLFALQRFLRGDWDGDVFWFSSLVEDGVRIRTEPSRFGRGPVFDVVSGERTSWDEVLEGASVARRRDALAKAERERREERDVFSSVGDLKL